MIGPNGGINLGLTEKAGIAILYLYDSIEIFQDIEIGQQNVFSIGEMEHSAIETVDWLGCLDTGLREQST